ncbi:MAG: carboxypeptidase M32 [Candidatus Thermoplasmatota archaeon]|jgi:carboxypeptidase Taq|nr:carboxypeptidase M32 [Candidatus Thermoplasmatota archaeon]
MANDAYSKLMDLYSEYSIMGQVDMVIGWDQNTYMPPGAAEMRGVQSSIIGAMRHRAITSRKVKDLLKEASREKELTEVQRSSLRWLRREHERKSAVPEKLVMEMARLEPVSIQAWIKARRENDFRQFLPILEKVFELRSKMAEHLGFAKTPYDALLEDFEPGMASGRADTILKGLRARLVPMVKRIVEEGGPVDDGPIRKGYSEKKQYEFGKQVLLDMGFDFNRGRMDTSAHPFTSGTYDDVRLTTRFDRKDLRPALFAFIHEGGHALYEQGLAKEFYGTPLGEAVSYGVHESQSRLWENQVGRSLPFWKHYAPFLRRTYPNMKSVRLEHLYRAFNMVRPSLIRVEADELTYNLHIMVRFEIEKGAMEGKVDLKDLPEVWDDCYERYLGITPPSVSQGCLQDIHWSMGLIGYFPTYSLGNLYAAQLMEAARRDLRDLDGSIEKGRFGTLLSWLRGNVHSKGRLYMAEDLMKRVTGKPLGEEAFISYMRTKFSDVYGLAL